MKNIFVYFSKTKLSICRLTGGTKTYCGCKDKLTLKAKIPAEIKNAFDEQCKKEGKKPTEVLIEIIKKYMKENKNV